METINTIESLKERFEASKLQVKIFSKETQIEVEDEDDITVEKKHLIVSFPEEREFKNVIIADDDELEKVFESNIEKYKFIKGYEAIWSSELKCVECEIEAQEGLLMPSRMILRRLKNFLKEIEQLKNEGVDTSDKTVYEFPSPKENLKIFIGDSTLDYTILQNFQRDFFAFTSRLRNRLTIRIEGKELKTHEEATDFLLKLLILSYFKLT